MKSCASFAVLLACLFRSQPAVASDPRCPAYEDKHSPSTYFPHATDCSKFYQCSNGESYLFDCQDGLLYNKHLLVCDWPVNVNCRAATSTTNVAPSPSTTTVAPSPSTPARPPSGGGNGGGHRPPSSGGSDDDVIVNDPRCPDYEDKHSPSTYFSHEADCSKFYQCSNGDPYLFDCPDGLLYNKHLLVCDWPKNVYCKAATSTTTVAPSPSTTTVAPSPSTSSPVTGPPGLCPYPDPEFVVHLSHPDPTKFYHCSHGVAYVKDCLSPLRFNAALEVCVW